MTTSSEHTPAHILVAIRVGEIIDQIGLPHMVCGSIASSIHGEPRSTNDIDFGVEFRQEHVDRLCNALVEEFFVVGTALQIAARSRSSCNVIHRHTGIKVDLFALRDRPFSRTELGRRSDKIAAPPAGRLAVTSVEDMVLPKLEWFREGGEVSDHKWRDVCGLLKLQRGRLDVAYLNRRAAELGIDDPLARVLRDVT